MTDTIQSLCLVSSESHALRSQIKKIPTNKFIGTLVLKHYSIASMENLTEPREKKLVDLAPIGILRHSPKKSNGLRVDKKP